jgi:hypothetical protein
VTVASFIGIYAYCQQTLHGNLKETGLSLATKPHAPYEIIFYSVFNNLDDSINCEKYFKTTAGWKRIKKMLENTLK